MPPSTNPEPLIEPMIAGAAASIEADRALALRLGYVALDRYGNLYRHTGAAPLFHMDETRLLDGLRLTSSLDDLAHLMSERFPDWAWRVGRDAMGHYAAVLDHYSGRHRLEHKHVTPALAMAQCVARLLDAKLDVRA